MTTQTPSKKDARLARAEKDFEQLKRLFNMEPKVKKTKPLQKIIASMDMYLRSRSEGEYLLKEAYGLKDIGYPDTNIIPRVCQMMQNLIPLFRLYRSNNLFNK